MRKQQLTIFVFCRFYINLNLITYALVVNSLALHRHRQRSSDPPLTAAA